MPDEVYQQWSPEELAEFNRRKHWPMWRRRLNLWWATICEHWAFHRYIYSSKALTKSYKEATKACEHAIEDINHPPKPAPIERSVEHQGFSTKGLLLVFACIFALGWYVLPPEGKWMLQMPAALLTLILLFKHFKFMLLVLIAFFLWTQMSKPSKPPASIYTIYR